MKNAYFIILGGGGGERLWPLSRVKRPKQFLKFLDERTLLEHTIDRVSPIAFGEKNVWVVTNKDQVDLVRSCVGKKTGFILDEPDSRNTGPAVLYSCIELQKKDPNAIAVFLPADSFVVQDDFYQRYLLKAIESANESGRIVTLGVMPTKALTSYGYIQAKSENKDKVDCGKIYDVLKFHEKPTQNLAEKYFIQNDMFWNIGVFVAKVSVFLEEFKKHTYDLFLSMQSFLDKKIEYKDIKNISVDYAVMEKSEKISILPCDFEWSDVGNLDVFLSLQQKISKNKNNNFIEVESSNNLVKISEHLDGSDLEKKIVAFVGVNDLCLIEEEDVIFVAKRDQVDNVKKALVKIREKSLERFL